MKWINMFALHQVHCYPFAVIKYCRIGQVESGERCQDGEMSLMEWSGYQVMDGFRDPSKFVHSKHFRTVPES
ncbi:hypothetical protein [Methanolobus sp.]|uniref:hypothetical protein n=1 Tax=Methanolobus sp. TaxID=1874737 RepID=UPI0025FD5E2C|nr:hypothetical protein [Methanolobus sp.]